ASHNYVVRAINGTCYTNSNTMAGTDANNTPGAPTITAVNDVDACAQSGVQIVYTAGSGATSHDLYRDGSLAVTGYASGATYSPGDTASHNYVVRAINGTCYTNSNTMAGTDANNAPGSPTITAVNDVDACAQSGVQIVYTAGSGATSHDLYRDGSLAVTGYASGATYNPGDTASHNYVVRAINGTCYTNSNTMAGTDANNTISAITLNATDAASGSCGVLITFAGGVNATQFDLYVDGGLAQSNITSGYMYYPADSSSHNYVVRGINGICANVDSNVSSVADPDCGALPPPPPEIATGTNYTWTANQTSQTMGWNSDATATGYRVYRGTKAQLPNLLNSNTDFCTRYDGTNLTLDVSTDNPATIDSTNKVVYYLIVAYNAGGEGPSGNASGPTPRVVNTTGNCP
ncbi:MAG: hypothetical protein GYA35_09835, partial [Thermoanaerobaculaceae bacterium]|nr:hypothetical protein [Thermoanaerobaculaceae bacterium]